MLVAEDVDGEPALNTFDPLKGRGDKLPISDYRTRAASFMPDFGSGILSPHGPIDRQDEIRTGRSPHSGPLTTRRAVENITFKNLTGDYRFYGWSLDGKGMYVGQGSSSWDFLRCSMQVWMATAKCFGNKDQVRAGGSTIRFPLPMAVILPSQSVFRNRTPGCWRIFENS